MNIVKFLGKAFYRTPLVAASAALYKEALYREEMQKNVYTRNKKSNRKKNKSFAKTNSRGTNTQIQKWYLLCVPFSTFLG